MQPIYTQGSFFWQGRDRFLIKGISYIPKSPSSAADENRSYIDPLSDDYITNLERDIPLLKSLGLNTVAVTAIDPTKSHSKAMTLLQQHGFYVLVTVCERMKALPALGNPPNPALPHPARCYTLSLMRRALRVIDQLADHPNLLAFSVSGTKISNNARTSLAQVVRAAIRDCKAFLTLRAGRKPPVGVNTGDYMAFQLRMLEYFTAGSTSSRADFVGQACYSWAHKSSFQISGWANRVRAYGSIPVPMYLSEYGTAIRSRLWEEIACLYSPDMTGVYSGGLAYTYFETGNYHGIVDVGDDDARTGKKDFPRLRKQFSLVNERHEKEVFGEHVAKDYEGWVGTFPTSDNQWNATPDLPTLPASLEALLDEIRREKEELLADGVSGLKLDDEE